MEKYIIASENGSAPDLIIDQNWPSPIKPDGEELCLGSYEYDRYPRLKLKIDDRNPAHPQLIVSRYEGEGGASEYTAWYNLNDEKWTMTKAIHEGEEWFEKEESLDVVTYELIDGKWVKTKNDSENNSEDETQSDGSSEDIPESVTELGVLNLNGVTSTVRDPFSNHKDIQELSKMKIPKPTVGNTEKSSSYCNEEEIFVAVEQQAEFPGGHAALMKWINTNLRYPEAAQQTNVQGRVVAKFVIEKDGSISNPTIVKSLDEDLDHEALRIVRKMPKWQPGKNNGQPVRSYFSLPVIFRRQNE